MKNIPQGTLSRAWNEFDTYLFDIDGTLLHCTDAVHYFAFCDALSLVAGCPVNLDGVTAHGNTDTGILRDAFAIAGVPESSWRPRILEIYEAMSTQVERNRRQICASALPGVKDVLKHLRSRGARLGVATGNLERIGRLKLQAAGLLEFFQFGGWSDALEQRSEVFHRAMNQARYHVGCGTSIVVIGDTPADVSAAHANGLPVIAVATGIYTYEALRAESPELCVHSFEELVPAP